MILYFNMSEILGPIPDGAARGWRTRVLQTPRDTLDASPDFTDLVDNNGLESTNPRVGTVSYGRGPEGYDRWIIREPNGGGAVTVPYIWIDRGLYVGANKVQRSAAGGPVTEVPRGFSLPQESHGETAVREFEEETGVTALSRRIKDLGGRPVNPNSTFFQADARQREGVKLYGLELNPGEVQVLRDSDNPHTRVYAFTPELQGRISEANEKINPKGIRFYHANLLRNTSDGFTQMAIGRLLTAPRNK